MQNSLNIRKVRVKSILSKSKVSDYTLNPYVGCSHGCTYCYARFMKRVSGISERLAEFVIIKVNAYELLEREVLRKKKGMSG